MCRPQPGWCRNNAIMSGKQAGAGILVPVYFLTGTPWIPFPKELEFWGGFPFPSQIAGTFFFKFLFSSQIPETQFIWFSCSRPKIKSSIPLMEICFTKFKVYPFWIFTFSSWQLNVRGRRPSTFNFVGKRLKSKRVYFRLLNVQ